MIEAAKWVSRGGEEVGGDEVMGHRRIGATVTFSRPRSPTEDGLHVRLCRNGGGLWKLVDGIEIGSEHGQ
jgi:hypothetical protein